MAGENEFGVSFTKSVRELQQLTAELSVLGKDLDGVEVKAGSLAKTYSRHLGNMRRSSNEVRKSLVGMGLDAEVAGKVADSAFHKSSNSLISMAQASTNAAAKADALRHKKSALANQLNQMAKDQEYTKWQQKIVAMYTKTAGETRHLKARLEELNGAQGIHNVRLKETVSARERVIAADAKQSAKLIELRAELDRLNSAEGQEVELLRRQVRERRRHIAAMADEAENAKRVGSALDRNAQAGRNYSAIIDQMIRNEREMAVTGEDLAWGYERLTQAQARFTSQQQRARAAIEAANREMVEGEQNLHRYTGANAQAAMAADQLAASEQRATNRRTQELKELRQAIEERARAEDRAYETTERLKRSDADVQVLMERKNRLIELQNRETLENARATQVMTNREAVYAKQLRESIALQRQRSALSSKTNMELLGLGGLEGKNRLHRDMNLNAQAAAMFRAGLGGLNASIGIYTSATVAAAAATYAFASALRNTVTVGMDFTEMMSRAEAIMMSSSDALTTAGKSMTALELQVRALGQSTVFTATEVSQGLVDLGMAGLSAAQSLQALRPALDLASIGGVQMSRSADIATNVMTAFKLEAGDLTGVVDVLATAVANSNTSVEQLANALSYVGPAAQAAGFDIKDTTAAIELLSNAGIKSSKAGTGLRRFMLSIQNPTSKGAKVLKQYGIGLQDAEGNTRDLIDILGQFNTALHRDGISPSKRMAAIVDLVGVRAASAVSRMVGSVDELAVLRRGMDRAGGAAEEMREKIEDNLTADWKQVKSSFQDLQLEVFDEFEWHMREAALSLTEFFQTLTTKGPDGVSELDRLIGQLHQLIDVAKVVGITFAAYKGFSIASTMLGAMGVNAGKASAHLTTFSGRMTQATAQQQAMGKSLASTNTLLNVQNTLLARSTSLMGTSAGVVGTLSGKLSTLGKVASVAGRALGWAGVVWGIYEAVKTAFGDTGDYIDSHKSRIESLRGEYDRLNQSIEATQLAKNRSALEAQRDADTTELSATRQQITDLQIARSQTSDPDVIRTIDDKLFQARRRADNLKTSLEAVRSSLGELGTSVEDMSSLDREFNFMVATLGDANREVERLSRLTKVPSQMYRAREELALQEAVASAISFNMSLRQKSYDEAESSSQGYVHALNLELAAIRERTRAEQEYDRLSVAEKLTRKQRELNALRAAALGMDLGDEQYLDKYTRLQERSGELQADIVELQYELQDLAESGSETWRQITDLQDGSKESLETLKASIAGVRAEYMGLIATAVVNGTVIDTEVANDLLKEQLELTRALINLKDEERRKSEQAANEAAREREQRISKARSLFDDLRGDFDPVGKELDQYKDQMAMLDSLRHATGENAISQEDYNAAVEALASRFRDNLTDADPFLAKLKEIRGEYTQFAQEIRDSYDDRSWIQDNMKGAERDLAMGEWNRQNEDQLFDGMPDVGGISADTGGAFSDYNNLMDEDSQQQEWFDEQIRRHQEMLDAKFINEREYTERVRALTAKRAEQIESTEHQSQVARLAGYGELFGELSGMARVFAGEQSGIYKAMFATSKAFAIADSIIKIQQAIANAATLPFPANLGAMGTVVSSTASIVGNIQAVSMATSEGGSGGGGGNYSGQYDTGGTIPRGSYGVVGEVGPEIVHGPAQVTGRKSTERQLAASKGGDHIEISPVIQVTVENQGGQDDQSAAEQGKAISKQVEQTVIQVLHREMRPNGSLDKWKRSR